LPGSMGGMLARLAERIHKLGLNLSVWDCLCRPVGRFEPCCEFCRLIKTSGGGCAAAAGKLAGRVVSEGAAAVGRSSLGCCVIGVPVYQRRRLAGATVACFPIRQMLEEESLARLSDRMHLDRQVVTSLAREACRHGTEQMDDFLHVLDWLLKSEQAVRVAGDELETLSANLAATYEELSLLYGISGSMKVTQQPREFLQNVCTELLEVMNIRAAAAIVYSHGRTGEEDIVVVAGRIKLDAGQVDRLAVTYLARRIAETGQAVLDNDFTLPPAGGPGGAVRTMIAVPLTAEEEPIGMLMGFNKLAGEFDSVDLKLINSIGDQAAVFLANSRLYEDLQDLLMGVLHALTASIDAKDAYTSGHSQRVAIISSRLAEACDFPPEKVQQIYLAGLLHDIGKIGIPESTLRKAGRLTAKERREVELHPSVGAKILGGIRQLDAVVASILTHHERPDGKGYPHCLAGDEVPIEGLILGLADAFDAMTSERAYRAAMPVEIVIEEIRKNAGTQFDTDLVEKFTSLDLEKLMAELRQPAQTVFPAGIVQEIKP